MPLKDKITRRMRQDAVAGTLAGVSAASLTTLAVIMASLPGTIMAGLGAVAMAWVALGAMGSYLRGREILRSPLFYMVAVMHDLGDGS